jgi:hypothetical protein
MARTRGIHADALASAMIEVHKDRIAPDCSESFPSESTESSPPKGLWSVRKVIVRPEDIMPVAVIPIVEPDVVVLVVPVPIVGFGPGLKVIVKPKPAGTCLMFWPFAAVGAPTELSPFGKTVARLAWLLGLAFWPSSPAGRTNINHSLHSWTARVGVIDRRSQRCRCARRCDRPKHRTVALLASDGSTDASVGEYD